MYRNNITNSRGMTPQKNEEEDSDSRVRNKIKVWTSTAVSQRLRGWHGGSQGWDCEDNLGNTDSVSSAHGGQGWGGRAYVKVMWCPVEGKIVKLKYLFLNIQF